MLFVTGGVIRNIGDAGAALLNPIQNIFYALVSALPGIVVAIILLIVGYVISAILGHAVRIILNKTGVDRQVERAKLSKAIGSTHVSTVLGEITKWSLFTIFFLPEIAEQLNLGILSALLVKLALWVPSVIAGILVMLVGLVVAHYITIKILEHSKVKGSILGAKIIKITIVIITAIIALDQIGVDVSILKNLVLIIVGALGVGLALALGIGIGLGMKKQGEELINDLKKGF